VQAPFTHCCQTVSLSESAGCRQDPIANRPNTTGINPKLYRGHELVLSADSNILYGTVRYNGARCDEADDDDTKRFLDDANINVARREKVDPVHAENPNISTRQVANPGYLTAILLSDPAGPPKPGMIQSKGYPLQMFMQAATPTTGGDSNAISPAPWNNGFFVLTDSEIGIVQIWRLDGLSDLPRNGVQPPKNKGSKGGNGGKGGKDGNGGKDGMSLLPPQLANIRANIVAEWRAPANAVGDPKLSQANPRGDDRRMSRAAPVALSRRNHPQKGRPAPGSGKPQGTRANGAARPIPSGRGCCADAVWYD
jgi:hypothetical protein